MSPSAIEVDAASSEPSTKLGISNGSQAAARDNPAHEEYQYLDLIRDILGHGEHRPDRSGRVNSVLLLHV